MMTNKIKISIVDSNIDTQKSLLNSIKKHDDIEVVNVSSDGELFLKSLESSKPDILIMDLLLPKVAGFEVLNYLKNHENYKDIIIIIMTALTSDSIIHRISEYNVEYVLDKPFNIDHLIKKSRYLYKMKQIENAKIIREKIVYDKNYNMITEVLISIGLKPHLSGFNYFKTAIYKTIKDESLLTAVTKELYPAVADIYDVEPSNIESSMRHVIRVAWKDSKHARNEINKYGYNMKLNERPSNSRFISILSNYLRLNGSEEF